MLEIEEVLEALEILIKENNPTQSDLYEIKAQLEETILVIDNELSLKRGRR